MILLDTNAWIWMHQGHRRARPLARHAGRLYLSPASVLELGMLLEGGRLRLRPGSTVRDLADDDRVLLDDPPAVAWFEHALPVGWTRDPFDRLIVAHATLRGWKIATADAMILERLGVGRCLEL